VKTRNKLTTIEKTAVFVMEQLEVGPKGEPKWSERVKGHRAHGGVATQSLKGPSLLHTTFLVI
jgi:hypothetical protein